MSESSNQAGGAKAFGTGDPHDFLEIGALLDDEERLLRDTVRQFVTDRILPDVADWFEEGTFPKDLAKEMGALGLLGMHLEGYGCAGTSAVAYGLACLELEAGDSGARSFVSVQGSLAMFPIWRFGSEEQKQEWLPRMAAGEVIGCFGLTEPDSGSDPASMRTRARRDGDDWVLNGTKMWITNGGLADVAIVWARADDGAGAGAGGGAGPIHGFIVPTDTPGFVAHDIHKKISLRASVTSELVLTDVRLPDSARLPEVSTMRGPLSCLNEARYGILWGATGAGRACYEAALAYARERVQFDRPIASFQLTQRKLVEMMVRVQKAELVALHLGRMKDQGRLSSAQVSFGKMDNVREALWVAREARSVLGANGITLEYPVIRHMNNLESVYTYEGTNEIHQLVLGQAITGISAFT
jgi:glutaryl-CoA dehydrogenase